MATVRRGVRRSVTRAAFGEEPPFRALVLAPLADKMLSESACGGDPLSLESAEELRESYLSLSLEHSTGVVAASRFARGELADLLDGVESPGTGRLAVVALDEIVEIPVELCAELDCEVREGRLPAEGGYEAR